MATAAQRVLWTVELLEAILLELELTDANACNKVNPRIHARTIIASQYVSKAFYETIRGSSKLQKAIGFQRDHSKEINARGDYLLKSWPIWTSHYPVQIGPVELEWGWRNAYSRFDLFYPKRFIESPSLQCILTVDATFPHFQFGSWRQLPVAPPDTSIEKLRLRWNEKNESFVFEIDASDTTHLINPTLGDLVEFAEGLVQGKKSRKLEMKLGDGGKNFYQGFNELGLFDEAL